MGIYEEIREKISREELLAQLAEEAAELAKAALKYRRILDGTNPTPISRKDAFGNLIEEIADVRLVISVLDMDKYLLDYDVIAAKKTLRWIKRLNEINPKNTDSGDLDIEEIDVNGFEANYENCAFGGRPLSEWPCCVCVTKGANIPTRWEERK